MKFTNKLIILLIFVCASMFGLFCEAQTTPPPAPTPNPSTTQMNFTLSVSFIGSSLGSSSNPGTDIAAELAANKVFPKIPAGWYFRTDNFIVPGAALEGNFGGLQGSLPYLAKYFNQKSFSPYIVGGLGVWRQTVTNVTNTSVGWNGGGGLNYDPTGTGKFTMNLLEVRMSDKGPIVATTLNLGVF